MRIPGSTVLIIYILLKISAANYCKDINGLKRCCKDYRMVNGTCVVCPAGFHGVDCTSICPSGFYGVKCVDQCRCPQGLECSPISGCQKQGCGSPPVKENTEILFTSSTYGSKAIYNCVNGFNQSGIDSITCFNNGTWETPLIDCVPKDCGTPPNVSLALTEVDATTYGSFARFICFENYYGKGVDYVTCTAEGVWEKTSFFCSITPEPEENDKPSNFAVYVGIAVTIFFVLVITLLVYIFCKRIKYFRDNYKGVAYVAGATKDDPNPHAYNEMHIYNDVDETEELPDQYEEPIS